MVRRSPPNGPDAGGVAGAGHGGGLVFEFWDGAWKAYDPSTQTLLLAALADPSRPNHLSLPGTKYAIKNAAYVEHGMAFQVNLQTMFERSVRLRPPYQVPGARSAQLPAGDFHFQYQDHNNIWQPFDDRLQNELRDCARSSPPPQQVVYAGQLGRPSHVYTLHGLHRLVDGVFDELVQVNVRTNKDRPVRLAAGLPQPTPSRPRVGGAVAGPRGPVPPTSWAGRQQPRPAPAASSGPRGLQQPVPHAAAGPSNAPAAAVHGGWSLSQVAVFQAVEDHWEPLDEEPRSALLQQWLLEPRPTQARLPGGVLVDGLGELELGGATLSLDGTAGAALGLRAACLVMSGPCRLQLRCTLPCSGHVALPASLEAASAFSPASCGQMLTAQEVDGMAYGALCCICMDGFSPSNKVLRLSCNHTFHLPCISQWFEAKKDCPECRQLFGKVIGNGPKVGSMSWWLEDFRLEGHADSSGTYKVSFEFPPSVDDNGRQYNGRRPACYLPGNVQGALLLELFKVAFCRRVMFGIGDSATDNVYRPTFNVHIKTSSRGGQMRHGYPDPTYFSRALQELRNNGVTLADLPQ